MTEKLLSIVIPSFNQGQYIERCLRSILSQKSDDLEVLVIDGGSTDQTVPILKKYVSHVDYWVSESDRGQSHAFNKGFQRARGRYVTWVNSDDLFLQGALGAFRQFVARWNYPDWIAANSTWIDVDDRVIRCTYNAGWSDLACRYGRLSVTGPSSFFSRKLLDRAGWFKEDFHYSMDTELWYRFARLGEKYRVLNHFVWALRLHEEAKVSGKDFTTDRKVISKIDAERARIHACYNVSSPGSWLKILLPLIRLRRLAKLRSICLTSRLKGRPIDDLNQK